MNDAPNEGNSVYLFPATDGSRVTEAQTNPVRDKSFAFALEIIELHEVLTMQHEYVISKQLMRSGTAIGALVEETIGAESRRDFLHKMSIAHKEAREAHYWLRLLDASKLMPNTDLTRFLERANELVSLLVSITRTVK